MVSQFLLEYGAIVISVGIYAIVIYNPIKKKFVWSTMGAGTLMMAIGAYGRYVL